MNVRLFQKLKKSMFTCFAVCFSCISLRRRCRGGSSLFGPRWCPVNLCGNRWLQSLLGMLSLQVGWTGFWSWKEAAVCRIWGLRRRTDAPLWRVLWREAHLWKGSGHVGQPSRGGVSIYRRSVYSSICRLSFRCVGRSGLSIRRTEIGCCLRWWCRRSLHLHLGRAAHRQLLVPFWSLADSRCGCYPLLRLSCLVQTGSLGRRWSVLLSRWWHISP